MLVLTRKKNESIVINNDITIVVVQIKGDEVRLGIEAPTEVPIARPDMKKPAPTVCQCNWYRRDTDAYRPRRTPLKAPRWS